MKNYETERYKKYKILFEKKLSNYKQSETKLFIKNILIRTVGILGTISRKLSKRKKVDVLFLLNSEQTHKRIKPIINYVNNELTVEVSIRNNIISNIKKFRLGMVPFNIPIELIADYSEAKYYSEIYEPKIIVMIENESLLSSYLKNLTDAKTINVAHGVRTNLIEHSNIDYDYYLIFGKSSLKHLKNNPYLFGTTTPIITGSPFLGAYKIDKKINHERKNIIYLAQYENSRVRDHLHFSNEIFIKFAKRNPNKPCIIKPHPLDDNQTWKMRTKGIKNVAILNKESNILNAINSAYVSVIAWSNAALESALIECPIIAIDRSGLANNNLDISDYFPVVKDVIEFENALLDIEKNHEKYKEVCKRFVDYHLGNIENSQKKIAETIVGIFNNTCVHLETITSNKNNSKFI